MCFASPFDDVLRESVVASARGWIGTRFLHQGRSKAGEASRGGVDCLGLLMGVAQALDLRGRNGAALICHDRRSYSKSPDGEALRACLGAVLFPVAPEIAQPGDIALFSMDGSPQHLAILSAYPLGGLGMIHAYAQARAVVEHRLDEAWQARIAGVYSLPVICHNVREICSGEVCMKLYVYDHCPYCVKARMIFGFKDLPFEMETLPNDDVETPTRLIGRKMVPILKKDDGTCMPESMDIVRYVDGAFGKPLVVGVSSPHVAAWLEGTGSYLYALCMPRWVSSPLKEFASKGARDYFTQKKEAMIGSFSEHLKHTDDYIRVAEEHFSQLEPLISSPDAVNGELSEDDIHLFAALRSLSIVRDMEYPTRVNAYRKRMAERACIPLHDGIAL